MKSTNRLMKTPGNDKHFNSHWNTDCNHHSFPDAKRSVLTELVKKPCSGSVVTATQHLMNPLREKENVCDGNPGTFYHSILRKEEETSPSILVHLGGTYRIMKITVVNVHTGSYCADQPEKCVKRLDGAKVEVLAGRKIGILCYCRSHPTLCTGLLNWAGILTD